MLSINKFGVMKNMGTSDALNAIRNATYEKLDQSIPIAIAFLDLGKVLTV